MADQFQFIEIFIVFWKVNITIYHNFQEIIRYLLKLIIIIIIIIIIIFKMIFDYTLQNLKIN